MDRAARLAVLIDADNARASSIKELLDEVARYGTATVKRAYGDWTTTDLKGWKAELHRHAIQPMQQFRYTVGKNATDSALIIDAMDLLHSKNVDGFCLVSSDSDFTRLATRMREAGLIVYGFGEEKTPEAFRAACNKFVFIEILTQQPAAVETEVTKPTVPVAKLEPLLSKAVEAAAREDGWATLGLVGSTLQKTDSSFDERNYGFKKLSDLVRKQKYLEVKEQRGGKDGEAVHLFVKLRQR
jgi:uncharacterized LabA/DUF88 family protein